MGVQYFFQLWYFCYWQIMLQNMFCTYLCSIQWIEQNRFCPFLWLKINQIKKDIAEHVLHIFMLHIMDRAEHVLPFLWLKINQIKMILQNMFCTYLCFIQWIEQIMFCTFFNENKSNKKWYCRTCSAHTYALYNG